MDHLDEASLVTLWVGHVAHELALHHVEKDRYGASSKLCEEWKILLSKTSIFEIYFILRLFNFIIIIIISDYLI